MPVFKFKTFEDAEKALWHDSPDEHYFQGVSDFFNFVDKLHPIRYKSGIFKFKTLSEANAHRDEQELDFAKKIYNQRRKTKKLIIDKL